MRRKRANQVFICIVLAFFLFVVLTPLYWSVILSFDRQALANLPPLSILPNEFTLMNYRFAFTTIPLVRLYMNTIAVTAINTTISVTVALMCGYAFAKGDFWGKRFWFIFMLAIMMMPFESRLVPLFLQYNRWGLLDTWWPLIFGSFSYVFGTFFARQNISALPDSLRESAFLDGSGEWRTFLSIIVPLSKPLIATLCILQVLVHWNSYLWPLVTIRTSTRQMLSVGVAMFNAQQDAILFGPRMAVAVISAIPLSIAFLFLQKYIVQSVAVSGIKQ